jgi:hypothetical protein
MKTLSVASYLRGLHDDAVSCGQSRGDFLDSDEQRVIKRLSRIKNVSVPHI